MKVKFTALMLSIGLTTALSSAYAQDDANNVPTRGADATRLASHDVVYRVRYALAADGDINVSRIHVVARDGAVILEGSVPESGQIDRAMQLAESSGDVGTVTNYLTLRTSGRGGS
jgi:hyperosmotically inducible protein